MEIIVSTFKSPVGELLLGSYNEQLCLADWKHRQRRNAIDDRIKKGLDAPYVEGQSKVILKTIAQLKEYFSGKRTAFKIPIKWVGTPFQVSVWEALQTIEYGQTNSYLELSEKLGKVKAIRAVASANGANALSIIVPCHRIIGSNGNLIGYAGGLPTKKRLLLMEGSYNNNQLGLFDEKL